MTLRSTLLFPFALAGSLAFSAPIRAAAPAQPVTLTRLEDRVRVEVGGKLFTEYVFKGASRPYCYPVLAADGVSLVRDFPMKETAGEDRDHPHHRALMFAHSNVNQVDFWNEGTAGTRFPKGTTAHVGIEEARGGDTGVLRVRNRWNAPDGRTVATDTTTLRFRAEGDARMIDYDVTIQAPPDMPVTMGDNKDGTMSIRIAQWMTMPHKMQRKDIPGVGRIV